MATNGMNTPDDDDTCGCGKPGCIECLKDAAKQAEHESDMADMGYEAESILSVNAAEDDMENRINGM